MNNKHQIHILPAVEDAAEPTTTPTLAEIGQVKKHGDRNPAAADAAKRAESRRIRAASKVPPPLPIKVSAEPGMVNPQVEYRLQVRKPKVIAAALAAMGIMGLVLACVLMLSGNAQASPADQLAMAQLDQGAQKSQYAEVKQQAKLPEPKLEEPFQFPKDPEARKHCEKMLALHKARPELVTEVTQGRYHECTAMFRSLSVYAEWCDKNPCLMNNFRVDKRHTVELDVTGAQVVEERPSPLLAPSLEQVAVEAQAAVPAVVQVEEAEKPEQAKEEPAPVASSLPPACKQFEGISTEMLVADRQRFEQLGFNIKGKELLINQAKTLTAEAQKFVRSKKAMTMLTKRFCVLAKNKDNISQQEAGRTLNNLDQLLRKED